MRQVGTMKFLRHGVDFFAADLTRPMGFAVAMGTVGDLARPGRYLAPGGGSCRIVA
jgi:hypothetical protein